ncbi:hypothetical protein JHK86_012151 [Glycine max]|nr:hypothetical protein JHK86_012151 [Glycine max]
MVDVDHGMRRWCWVEVKCDGSYPPSVSNSFKASKLVINQPVMEIQEFIERYFLHVLSNHSLKATTTMSSASSTASSKVSYILRYHLPYYLDISNQLPPSVTQCLIHCGDHMTILRRFGPPLQWNVIVLDKGIGDMYITQPWYKFLQEGDFSHGDELSFYYRRAEKIWEVVIRRAIDWDDNDID